MTTLAGTQEREATETNAAEINVPASLDQYYSEAGPDYFAWSPSYNMHFGFFRWGANPLNRERMLEQMNVEVGERLHLRAATPADVLDLGCGVGATLRSFAARLPLARLTGVTLVPWQIQRASELNVPAPGSDRIRLVHGDYQGTYLPGESYDAVYAVESCCYGRDAARRPFLAEAHRLLRPGGRLVVADGFLGSAKPIRALQRPMYRRMCDCWAIDQLASLDLFEAELERLGFRDIRVERIQMRVAPSVFHVPWVTAKFLLTNVVFGKRKMTQARWNNVIAPAIMPLVGWPIGPMVYAIVSATKA